jgi:hypothetical protein
MLAFALPVHLVRLEKINDWEEGRGLGFTVVSHPEGARNGALTIFIRAISMGILFPNPLSFD